RREEFAGTRRAIVQITVDGAHDRRALQIQLRRVDRDVRIRERRFRLVDARAALFRDFGGDEFAELAIAHVFAARLVERRAPLLRGGLRLTQRERVAGVIDHEQHLALPDLLVVHYIYR